MFLFFFFFKQKTAYEMRISDWSSDVCSSDLSNPPRAPALEARWTPERVRGDGNSVIDVGFDVRISLTAGRSRANINVNKRARGCGDDRYARPSSTAARGVHGRAAGGNRSEEHTSHSRH